MLLHLTFFIAYLARLSSQYFPAEPQNYRPIVMWHGMGDSCCDPRSMGKVKDFIESVMPGVYVKSIRIGNSESEDRKSTYFGNFNKQVEQVCKELANDEKLKDGFNALGWSQGGQGMRAYVERCNSPRVYNLVTFGSQHSGVYDIPGCQDKTDGWCGLMRTLAKRGVYVPYVQERVIQAQYFKKPEDIDGYLKHNIFLPDINNEHEVKNETYADNIKSLDRFVMVKFEDDITVVPRQSSWFGFVDKDGKSIPLEQQPLFTEDWLGLRWLSERGRLLMLSTPGQHMQISLAFLRDEILLKYFIETDNHQLVMQQ